MATIHLSHTTEILLITAVLVGSVLYFALRITRT